MRHVFVETNFLIELLRPLSGADAHALYARNKKDVTLYVPWVSLVECKRTLERIVREDTDFEEQMMKLANRELLASRLQKTDMKPLQDFAALVRARRVDAISGLVARVDDVAARVEVIEPTKDVIQKTLSLYPIKSLPPFDEMVMGAVLTKAETLLAAGAPTPLYFCNLNKKDFDPERGDRRMLVAEYNRLHIAFTRRMPDRDPPNHRRHDASYVIAWRAGRSRTRLGEAPHGPVDRRQAALRTFSRTTPGCRTAMRSKASAGPSGVLRSCSQFRSVCTLIPSASANRACVRPMKRRNAATSPGASSPRTMRARWFRRRARAKSSRVSSVLFFMCSSPCTRRRARARSRWPNVR